MKKKLAFLIAMAAFVCAFCATTTAMAGPGWRYKASHGMENCEFSNPVTPGAAINGGIVGVGYRTVTLAGQAGSSVRLTLICRRSQTFDNQGDLTFIGPEVSYSGPGTPKIFGVDRPGDPTPEVETPKGREWMVAVGTSPVTYTIRGGSDSIAVTVQPLDAPATVPWVQSYVAPIAKRAEQAYEAATTYDYRDRVISITGSYILHLDSAIGTPKGSDASQGFGADIDVTLGGQSKVKFLTGLTMDFMFRQKKVAYAPNAPTNGDNNYVAWQTVFAGPKAGASYMPTKWFELSAYGSIGALVSIDGTIPVSQLQNMELYIGESKTTAALGYKSQVCPAFLIADHFKVGACLGLQGNFTPLPASRGPERIANADGSVFVRRDGNFLNDLFGLFAGGQF